MYPQISSLASLSPQVMWVIFQSWDLCDSHEGILLINGLIYSWISVLPRQCSGGYSEPSLVHMLPHQMLGRCQSHDLEVPSLQSSEPNKSLLFIDYLVCGI